MILWFTSAKGVASRGRRRRRTAPLKRVLRTSTLAAWTLSRLGTSAAHHLHEFLKVDLAIAVGVDIGHEVGNVPHGNGRDVSVSQDQRYLLFAYPPVPVAVEDAERGPADVLLQVHLPVQGRGQELRVVDHAAAVRVDLLENLLQVRGDLLEARPRHALPELLGGQQAVPVLVEGGERVPEHLDLVLAELARDDVEGGLLQLVLRSEGPQVIDQAGGQCDILGLRRLVRDPDVLQCLRRREPLLRVQLEKHPDKMFGIFRDILPVGSHKAEVPKAHLRQDISVSVPMERWVAAKQHVHDDPATPQVRSLVVLAGEDLRRHVVGRARLRREHRVGPELPGEAEVDDLQAAPLDAVFRGEEEVLGFQVSVADAVLVHVVDGAEDVLHHHRGLDLGEVA
mmetsp:Transcript_98961/g.308385  ORF Transcript_98961/g.308385 Transcript_98961/m.308385 type:complete len:396 (-) Transcript_98961:491-1678(-)